MLQEISRYVMLQSACTANLGLYNGKMGAIIYFFNLAKYTGNHTYHMYAEELLDQLFSHINISYPLNFADGFSGIAWGIEYLMHNNFIEPNSNDTLEELDEQIFKINFNYAEPNNLLYGLEGFAYYLISRYNNCNCRDKLIKAGIDLLDRIKSIENPDDESTYLKEILEIISIGGEVKNTVNDLFIQIIANTTYDKQLLFNDNRALGILNNGYSAIGLKIIGEKK